MAGKGAQRRQPPPRPRDPQEAQRHAAAKEQGRRDREQRAQAQTQRREEERAERKRKAAAREKARRKEESTAGGSGVARAFAGVLAWVSMLLACSGLGLFLGLVCAPELGRLASAALRGLAQALQMAGLSCIGLGEEARGAGTWIAFPLDGWLLTHCIDFAVRRRSDVGLCPQLNHIHTTANRGTPALATRCRKAWTLVGLACGGLVSAVVLVALVPSAVSQSTFPGLRVVGLERPFSALVLRATVSAIYLSALGLLFLAQRQVFAALHLRTNGTCD